MGGCGKRGPRAGRHITGGASQWRFQASHRSGFDGIAKKAGSLTADASAEPSPMSVGHCILEINNKRSWRSRLNHWNDRTIKHRRVTAFNFESLPTFYWNPRCMSSLCVSERTILIAPPPTTCPVIVTFSLMGLWKSRIIPLPTVLIGTLGE